MKQWLLGLAIAAIGFAMVIPEAEAKRLGGARSSGAQRSITNTPPPAVPAKPAQAQQAAPGTAAAAQPASGLSRWAPMLGGLAIGGLLASMFGGSALGGIIMTALMLGLLAFAGMFIYRMLAQKRAEPVRPMQYAAARAQGAYPAMGNETVAAPPPSQMAGFDAREPAPAASAGSIPAGFDVEGFVKGAKMNFIRLQAANDSGNVEELREFTTPEMFEELKNDIAGRAGANQETDVVQLNADLLEVTTEGGTHWASLRFSGLIREMPGQAPEAFAEVWSLAKPVDGSTGWVLAGIQQMH